MKINFQVKNGRKIISRTIPAHMQSVIDNSLIFLGEYEGTLTIVIQHSWSAAINQRRSNYQINGNFVSYRDYRPDSIIYVYVKNNLGETKQRETLAHELGHAVQYYENKIHSMQVAECESEADSYAALFCEVENLLSLSLTAKFKKSY